MQRPTRRPQVLTSFQGHETIQRSPCFLPLFTSYVHTVPSFPDSSGESAEDDSEKDVEESEQEEEEDDCADEGMELLLKEGDNSPPSSSSRPKKEISHIAATAESLQPKGYTLATTKVSDISGYFRYLTY